MQILLGQTQNQTKDGIYPQNWQILISKMVNFEQKLKQKNWLDGMNFDPKRNNMAV